MSSFDHTVYNQLGNPHVDLKEEGEIEDMAPSMRIWNKPYELPSGDAVYYGVSPVNGTSEQILVPFIGTADIVFKSKFHPQGVPLDKVSLKYNGKPHEEIYAVMNEMLKVAKEEIKANPSPSDLVQKLAAKTIMAVEPQEYPRKDNSISAKFKVKDGSVLTSFIGIADYEAFKKKAMSFIAKKKPIPVAGVFHVQGVVLSDRGLDVCVKLWEVSVRK